MRTLYAYVVRGNNNELPIIADELERSAAQLVRHSKLAPYPSEPEENNQRHAEDAYAAFFVIANRQFCRHVVDSCPMTAYAFFDEMAKQNKYRIPIGEFAAGITTEVIDNKDSVLYHEERTLTSGLMGHQRQWTRTVYGNHDLLEGVVGPSPLEVDRLWSQEWAGDEWRAYSRVVLTAFEGYLNSRAKGRHSSVIYSAIETFEFCCIGVADQSDNAREIPKEIVDRFEAVTNFICGAVELLDNSGPLDRYVLRRVDKSFDKDVYDWIVDVCYWTLFNSTSVTAPSWDAWHLQHNVCWDRYFSLAGTRRAGG